MCSDCATAPQQHKATDYDGEVARSAGDWTTIATQATLCAVAVRAPPTHGGALGARRTPHAALNGAKKKRKEKHMYRAQKKKLWPQNVRRRGRDALGARHRQPNGTSIRKQKQGAGGGHAAHAAHAHDA
jgi:hypothetical protein